MVPAPSGQDKARVKQRAPGLDAVAGAVAGAVSRFAIGPLDVLKIRFQVQIEPLRPPAQSLGGALTSKYTGVKQAALTILREEGIPVGPPAPVRRPATPCACWSVGTGQAARVQPGRGLPAPQGLWRGTVPGLLLTVPYTAVQFFALQSVRNLAAATELERSGAGHLISFGSGAVAGAAATAASYPFDLLRTTLAAQGEPKVRPRLCSSCTQA